MSYQTLVGAKFFMSTGLAGAVALNSISNGAPPVATTGAAHGGIDNDEYLVLTSWDDFNETSDVNWYPPASSGGTVQKISGWQEIGQVLGITPNGGDAKFEEVNPFDRRNGIKIPTGFSAASLEMTLGWDRSRTDQQLLQVASRSAGKRAFKFVLPGGIYGYAYGTVSASGLPVFETIMKQKVSVTMNGMFTTFG
jgi:hypothetical protein